VQKHIAMVKALCITPRADLNRSTGIAALRENYARLLKDFIAWKATHSSNASLHAEHSAATSCLHEEPSSASACTSRGLHAVRSFASSRQCWEKQSCTAPELYGSMHSGSVDPAAGLLFPGHSSRSPEDCELPVGAVHGHTKVRPL